MSDWSLLHARLHQLVQANPSAPGTALLPARSRPLVAVSGGQDSLCLLKLLQDLAERWRWQLAVVHCDHQWRPDSAENAAFVLELAQQWGLPCQVVRAEVAPNSEAAARRWRYQVFEAVALAQGCTHVVTGHTATDRAETLLYNLVRGSGADGLQALGWQRSLSLAHPDIQLVRPLLGLTRAETGQFCQRFELPVWQDATNRDRAYARNRLRLDVMPYLCTHFNPNVERTLAQTAEILAAEVEALEQLAAVLYQQAVICPGPGEPWRLRRAPLQGVPLALQRRVLRRLLQHCLPAQVSFAAIEKLVRLLNAPNRSQSDPFVGGAIARVEQGLIVIAAPPASPEHPTQVP